MKFNRLISLPLVGFAVIAALSGCGGDNNSLATAPELDTTPPPAPLNVVLSADASGHPMLVWDASAAADVAGYQVQVHTGADYVAADDPVTSDTSFLLPMFTMDVEASYRVRAVDASGNWSAYSQVVNIVIPAIAGGSGGKEPYSVE